MPNTPQEKTFTPRTLVLLFIVIVVAPLLPVLISRRWGWWEAWVYACISIFGFVVSRVLAARRHPDLLLERACSLQHQNVEPWDKVLAPLVGFGTLLIPLTVGIDAGYDGSPAFSLPVILGALIILLTGYVIGTYAMIENRFFSGVVRIQTDRDHKLVSTGPYQWVRHPGYTGALLVSLATPIVLDALWAFLPALFLLIVLVIRTMLEDRVLQEELAGYRDYATRVRYRLLIGIW